jgi:hypothetical protein
MEHKECLENHANHVEQIKHLDEELKSNKESFRAEHESWIRPLKTKKYYKLCLELKKKYMNLHVECSNLYQEVRNMGNMQGNGSVREETLTLMDRIDNRLKVLDAYLNDMLFYTTINNTRFAIIVAVLSFIIGCVSLSGFTIGSVFNKNEKQSIRDSTENIRTSKSYGSVKCNCDSLKYVKRKSKNSGDVK